MRTPVTIARSPVAVTATLVAVLAAGLVASGCAGATGSGAAMPLTPISRYSLQVEPGLDRIALAVHDTGLSAPQRAALVDLAARFSASGADHIRVEAPSGDDPVSGEAAWGARTALEQAGVPGSRIQVAAYIAPDPRAPVLAGFETITARVPSCAGQHGDMGGRLSNESSIGLGCAITANMAAQIADPRDIVAPRAMTPSDSARAAVIFDNYRGGQPTSAPQDTLVGGRIARAVE
jgi:pilus assembly protein CpaD